MIYYGCTHSIFFSEDFVRDIMLHSDYAFTQDSKSGHWKFLKYRYSKEGLNTQFFDVKDLLDYVYKDLMNCFHQFPRELMGHLTPLPELDYSDISQFSHKSPPKAPKEPKAAPVVKPATPVQTPKEAPAPKVDKGLYDFNVKGIVSRYEKILVLLNEISKEGAILKTQFSKVRKGRNISNIDTPELMNLYTSVETAAYTSSLAKEVRDYMRTAQRVVEDAKVLQKKESK